MYIYISLYIRVYIRKYIEGLRPYDRGSFFASAYESMRGLGPLPPKGSRAEPPVEVGRWSPQTFSTFFSTKGWKWNQTICI